MNKVLALTILIVATCLVGCAKQEEAAPAPAPAPAKSTTPTAPTTGNTPAPGPASAPQANPNVGGTALGAGDAGQR